MKELITLILITYGFIYLNLGLVWIVIKLEKELEYIK